MHELVQPYMNFDILYCRLSLSVIISHPHLSSHDIFLVLYKAHLTINNPFMQCRLLLYMISSRLKHKHALTKARNDLTTHRAHLVAHHPSR